MAGSNVSTVATRMTANAAAIATAAAGGVTPADIQALGSILALLALSPDIMIPLMSQATTPSNATTMLNPA